MVGVVRVCFCCCSDSVVSRETAREFGTVRGCKLLCVFGIVECGWKEKNWKTYLFVCF